MPHYQHVEIYMWSDTQVVITFPIGKKMFPSLSFHKPKLSNLILFLISFSQGEKKNQMRGQKTNKHWNFDSVLIVVNRKNDLCPIAQGEYKMYSNLLFKQRIQIFSTYKNEECYKIWSVNYLYLIFIHCTHANYHPASCKYIQYVN